MPGNREDYLAGHEQNYLVVMLLGENPVCTGLEQRSGAWIVLACDVELFLAQTYFAGQSVDGPSAAQMELNCSPVALRKLA